MIKNKHNRRSKPIKKNQFDKSNTLQISITMYYEYILYPENIARLQLHSCTNIYMFLCVFMLFCHNKFRNKSTKQN